MDKRAAGGPRSIEGSKTTLRLLMLAAFATAAGATDAVGSPFTDRVEVAVFELCPGLRSGRIVESDLGSLRQRGFHRTPQREADLARAMPSYGNVWALSAGDPSALVWISYWPQPAFCSISIRGTEAAAAMGRVRERFLRHGSGFRREPRYDRTHGLGTEEAYRSEIQGAVISLMTPAADDQSQTFVINFNTTR